MWNKSSTLLVYHQDRILDSFAYDRSDAMKWFYKWRLNKVRAEIAALKKSTETRLKDDYTGHSRLRVLICMERSLKQRLERYQGTPTEKLANDGGELKQT
jgi:hypothetical protein